MKHTIIAGVLTIVGIVSQPFINHIPHIIVHPASVNELVINTQPVSQIKADYAVKTELELKYVAPTPQPVVAPVVVSHSLPSNEAKAYIYQHESGNNPASVNRSSGACGLGQAWPCSKLPCSLSDYVCEDNWFTNYMLERYGSWEIAYQYWLGHSNW